MYLQTNLKRKRTNKKVKIHKRINKHTFKQVNKRTKVQTNELTNVQRNKLANKLTNKNRTNKHQINKLAYIETYNKRTKM